jgi:hypothetical protein
MKKTTSTILAAAVILTGSAHAAVSIVGSADFTLSSTTSPGTSHDNLPSSWPTAFYELVDPAPSLHLATWETGALLRN